MGVHFIMKRGEIFQVLLMQNSGRLRRNIKVWCPLASAAYLALSLAFAAARDISVKKVFNLAELFGLIALFLFAAAAIWVGSALSQLFDMGKRGYYEEREVLLREDGLELLRSGRQETLLSYGAVRELVLTWNFLLIRRAYAKRMDYLEAIPRRAFRNEKEECDFVQALKEKCKGAGSILPAGEESRASQISAFAFASEIPLFTFQFSFSPEEWLKVYTEAQECRSRFERDRKRGIVRGLALPAFFLAFVAAGLFELENSAPAAIFGLFILALFYIFRLLFRGKREKIHYWRMFRQGRLPMEQASDWRIAVYPAGLIAEYKLTRRSCPFERLIDAAETEKYMFLFEQTGDFYPIPKSAMGEGEKQRFWDMMEKRLNNT